MADCVLCGGHNNFEGNRTTDPVEAFKDNDSYRSGYPWNPQDTTHRCCAVVCEDCCNGFATKSTLQCTLCRHRVNLWVIVNVLGTEGVVPNE